MQSGSIPTGQGQGYGQLRPSQVTGQRSVQLGDRDQLPVLLSTHFSTMASGQEIIPVKEAAAALYDDTSMNGSNGPVSPIVVRAR